MSGDLIEEVTRSTSAAVKRMEAAKAYQDFELPTDVVETLSGPLAGRIAYVKHLALKHGTERLVWRQMVNNCLSLLQGRRGEGEELPDDVWRTSDDDGGMGDV